MCGYMYIKFNIVVYEIIGYVCNSEIVYVVCLWLLGIKCCNNWILIQIWQNLKSSHSKIDNSAILDQKFLNLSIKFNSFL